MANRTKKQNTRVVSEFFKMIDLVVFSKSDPKEVLPKEKYELYLKTKSSFIENLFELARFTNTKFETNTKNSPLVNVKSKLKNNIPICERYVEMNKSKLNSIKNINEKRNIIKGYYIDTMFVKEIVENSDKYKDEWKFKLLIDSHRVLRDRLVDFSNHAKK